MTNHTLVHTPWGNSDHEKVYAEGVIFYGTPSHGGFKLDAVRNARVHPALRENSGFYEEDCSAAKVIFTFPELFTKEQGEAAIRSLKNNYPDAWEVITGAVLAPGESWVKDQRQFHRDHADDWIVISALSSDHHPGMVECIATMGGTRDIRSDERRFLVPQSEYRQRDWRFGFVIDVTRQKPYDGPSSFVTWQPAQGQA